MEFVLYELKSAMARLKKTLGGRHQMPVLGCVHFAPEGADSVRITTTELEASTSLRVECAGEHPEILVNHAELTAALKSAPPGLVRLEPEHLLETGGTNVIKVVDDSGTLCSVESFDPEQYPKVGSIPEDLTFGPVGPNALLGAMAHITHAISRDETRYNLNGVSVQKHGTELRFAATDGHRMALHRVENAAIGDLANQGKGGAILPRVFWDALKPMCKAVASGGVIELAVRGNRIWAREGDDWLCGRLLEGDYPAYLQVLPKKDLDNVFKIDRKRWIASLTPLAKREKRLGKGFNVALKFDSEDAMLLVGCEESGLALPVLKATESRKEEFGINPRYLLECLKGFTGKTISATVSRDEEVFSALSFSDGETKGVSIVMPSRP